MQEQVASARAAIRLHHRISFTAVATLLLISVALFPLFIASVIGNFLQPTFRHTYRITPADTQAAQTYSRLQITLLALDEWSGRVTLEVSGTHVCEVQCARDDRFLFVSIPTDPGQARLAALRGRRISADSDGDNPENRVAGLRRVTRVPL